MGASSSADVKVPKSKKGFKKHYKPPEKRLKERYDPEENTSFTSQHAASIDKFDYLIVFPLTEGAYTDPLYRKGGKEYGSRISWEEVAATWSKAVPGTEEIKKEAVDRLAEFWKKRCGLYPKGSDELLLLAWSTVAREAIIDTLVSKSGLQIKLSANSRKIFCRIRAPIKLLELQADKDNYRLSFRGEIDPGSDAFWNVEVYKKYGKEHKTVALEIEEEKAMLTKDEANVILEKLYRAGKISPNDMSVNSEFEVASTWTRRVHALERIADKVVVKNDYVAYTPFMAKPHLRYLFENFPGVRGRSLFRAKDRLFLTKSIIDGFFDMGIFVEENIISDIMALHDANRGDIVTIEILFRRWVTFWRPSAAEVGAPMVTSAAYEDDVECPWYQRPLAQPLKAVRDYFGEKVALYFAWLGFYTFWLLFPAVLGSLMLVLYNVRGYVYTVDHLDWFLIGFEVLIIAWSVAYKQGWDRNEKAIALKWGTRGFESEEKDRPQFQGDKEEPLRRSFVTNRKETYFPDIKRTYLGVYSVVSIFFAIAFVSAFFGGIFYTEYLVTYQYPAYKFKYFEWGVVSLIAIMIEVFSYLYLGFSAILADGENHRTETSHEDSLIAKTVFFKIFNHYGAVIFTIFGKGPLLGTCSGSCLYNAQQLLFAIFILRFLLNIEEVLHPYLRICAPSSAVEDKTGGIEERQALNSEPDEALQFILEVDKEAYGGTFHDYAEAVVQFGYVNLFSVVLPYLGLVALLENLLKIRMDAWKLCTFYQRPHISIAEDVGGWATLMDLMSSLGVVCSVAILVFAMQDLDEYSLFEKVVIFLVAEQVLLVLKSFIQSFLPGDADWVQELAARNVYISDKFARGVEDEDDDLDIDTIKGGLDDTIDVDGLNLTHLRKSKKSSPEIYRRTEELEARRRVLLKELQVTKSYLEVVFQTENFNEYTGIGESKAGLPLGRLSIRIATLFFPEEDLSLLGLNIQVRLRVNIKSSRSGAEVAGPPVGPKSYSTAFKVEEGGTPVNQQLGPFAPIRSQHADVVIDMLSGQSDTVLGTTSLRLAELADQELREMTLHFKLRHPSGDFKQSEASMGVSCLFQYSKVDPIRKKISQVQDRLSGVEKELASLKAGKELEALV